MQLLGRLWYEDIKVNNFCLVLFFHLAEKSAQNLQKPQEDNHSTLKYQPVGPSMYFSNKTFQHCKVQEIRQTPITFRTTPWPCPRNEVLISGIFQAKKDVIVTLKRKQLSSEYHLVMWKSWNESFSASY